MTGLIKVVVYIDWDTVRRLDKTKRNDTRGINYVFEVLRPEISSTLNKIDKHAKYRVYWRIYHGWHQGSTKTEDRKIFDQYTLTASSTTIANTSFGTDFSFSGDMACGSKRSPVLDTMRTNRQSGEKNQKMVDTLLACDLLHLARSKYYGVHIVVANDDDIIPAIFTAEAWNSKIMLLHSREHTNNHLNLNGITERMGA